MDRETAVRIVACRVIENAVVSQYGEMWEEFPDIGERDWEAILAQVDRILDGGFRVAKEEEFDPAYLYLAMASYDHLTDLTDYIPAPRTET